MGFMDKFGGNLIGAAGQVLGAGIGALSANSAAEKNAALQREVLQNQIQWRVKDAEAAGIHPLAALGLSPASASPVYSPASDFASSLGELGKSVGDAFVAYKNREQIEEEQQEKARRDAEDRQLSVDTAKSEINKNNALAQEAIARAKNVTAGVHYGSGNETVPGQVNSFSDIVPGEKFMMFGDSFVAIPSEDSDFLSESEITKASMFAASESYRLSDEAKAEYMQLLRKRSPKHYKRIIAGTHELVGIPRGFRVARKNTGVRPGAPVKHGAGHGVDSPWNYR